LCAGRAYPLQLGKRMPQRGRQDADTAIAKKVGRRQLKRLGGAGITVEPRWFDFENLLHDVGPRRENTHLARIDKADGYHPGNTVWRSDQPRRHEKFCSPACYSGSGRWPVPCMRRADRVSAPEQPPMTIKIEDRALVLSLRKEAAKRDTTARGA
jgi:hypothetical protein